MPIILISSDGIESAEQIARESATKLSYQLLGPNILSEIAAQDTFTAERLTQALTQLPAAWRPGQSKRWKQQLACVEAQVLDRLQQDNIVCWGVAAHLYVLGVSHALKVRLMSDNERKAYALSEERKISLSRAKRWLENQRLKREQWSKAAFGQNECDCSMYDLIINLDQIDPSEAVGTICTAVGYRKFQPMTYSIQSLSDDALAAKVKFKLLGSLTDIQVEARDGTVIVTSKALKRERQKKASTIKELAGAIAGVKFVEVHLINYVIRAAAESNR